MATFLLKPDLVPAGRGPLLVDSARGLVYRSPSILRRVFPKVVEFLRTPRSRAEIRRFLLARGVRTDGDEMEMLAPVLVASDRGSGSTLEEVYERRSRLLARADQFVFMNHGYASDREGDRSWIRPEDREARYHLNLVRETLRGVPLDGRNVLDVGCGRGGTCSYLVRYHRPTMVRGLDFSASNVAFCRRRHRRPNLRFERGDAHALPFARATFHVVTNLESSHCYPAVWKFHAEVWRVLKRRGSFCYADLMRPDQVDTTTRLLRHAGFQVLRRRDVTSNVCLALERNAANLRRMFRSIAASSGTRAVARHLRELERGIHGEMLRRYRRGSLVYRIWLLRKP